MTVAELIEELKKYPSDLEACIGNGYFETENINVVCRDVAIDEDTQVKSEIILISC